MQTKLKYLEYCCVAACTHQQAPLCQRYSQVQAGSEALLQTDQRAVANHGLWDEELSAGGVEGTVRFSTQYKESGMSDCKDQQWTDDFSFQKHENEFNEAGALRELYKFIEKYFKEVSSSCFHFVPLLQFNHSGWFVLENELTTRFFTEWS